MRIDRRQFLVSTGAAAIACDGGEVTPTEPDPPVPAPEREPSPAAPAPDAPVDLLVFPRGVQVGDPTGDAALVIVHSSAPQIELVWMRAEAGAWVDGGALGPVDLEDGYVQVELTGLLPDTAYAVWARADGVCARPTRFRTAPDGLRKVRLGATSCMGGTNPAMQNLAFVPERDVDLMLLLGDTVYADGSVTRDDFRGYYDRLFERASVHDLFAGAGVVATWDDHEVANNWALDEGTPLQDIVTAEILEAATDVWRESVPMRLGPGGTQVWRRVAWGPHVDLFVLDCRAERGPARLVGEEQLAWLIDGLQASTARFKLVLVSVHMTDHFEMMSVLVQEDRWQGYPDQRGRLLAVAREVPGVLFVTGDMHFGAVQRVDPAGAPAEHLYEIAAGPSGSRLFPVDAVAQIVGGPPAQYETLVEAWNWTEIELDPGTGDVVARFIGDDGSVIAEQAFSI